MCSLQFIPASDWILDIEYWCWYCAVTRSSGCGGGRVWAAHCTLGIVIHICYLGPDYRLWMWGSGSWAWVWRPLAPLSIISIIYSSCQYAWETRPTGAGACLIVKGYIQGQPYVHSDAIIAMILDHLTHGRCACTVQKSKSKKWAFSEFSTWPLKTGGVFAWGALHSPHWGLTLTGVNTRAWNEGWTKVRED